MTTINIIEGVTLTVSNATAELIAECKAFEAECMEQIAKLRKWQKMALDERDWSDWEDYDVEIYDLWCGIRNKWEKTLGYEI